MIPKGFSFFLLTLALSAVTGPVSLPAQHFDYTPDENIVTYLVTVGPGDDLYSWWGHTAIVVEDTETGRRRLFDYGLFTFSEDDFVKNFIFGRLWFSVGNAHPRFSLAMWSSEDRDIRFRRMNLSGDMKREMIALLESDSRPGHNTYLYDHYWDNCATRERDIIDIVLDGQFRQAHLSPSETTLRKISRRYMKGHFLMEFLLMFLLGPGSDVPITEWDEMFVPEKLEHYAAAFFYSDENGNPVKLTDDETVYARATVERPVPPEAPNRIPVMLAAGIAAALLFFLFYRLQQRNLRYSRLPFILVNGVFTFVFGITGSLLLFMMFFTDHSITYGNENLVLANPLLLAAFILLFVSLRRKRVRTASAWLFTLLAAGSLVLVVYKLLVPLNQDNWEFVALFLPIYMVLGPLPLFSSRFGSGMKR